MERLTLEEAGMMEKRGNLMSLENIGNIHTDLIPLSVLQDVDKRISDWLAMGGKEDDSYIQRQIKYLKQVEKVVTKERRGAK